MAKYQILSWKDIPSVVEAHDGGTAREVADAVVNELEDRFAEFRSRGLGEGE